MSPIRKLFAAAAVAAAAASPVVFGGVPNLISYQGRLLSAAGSPITYPTTMRFRLYRGGGASEYPSLGTVVYDETVLIQPTADGVISHMIGSGIPAVDCPEGLCTLKAGDFGDGTLPIWIEAMVDPDGVLGNGDDDVLLPRTLTGTVAFAYKVASLEGAAGGALTGTLSTSSLTATGGATFGSGSLGDITLRFDRTGSSDPTLKWNDAASRFDFSTGVGVSGNVTSGDGFGLTWPTSYDRCTDYPNCAPSGTVNSRMVFGHRSDVIYGQRDNTFYWAYNLDLQTGLKIVPNEPLFKQQIETSFFAGPNKLQLLEYNWDYQPANNSTGWRPFYFIITTGGQNAGDILDTAEYQLKSCSTCNTLRLTRWGTVEMGEFHGTRRNVLNVQQTLESPTDFDYGTRSILDLQLDATAVVDAEPVGLDGTVTWSGASVPNSFEGIVGTRGEVDVKGSATVSRTLEGDEVGVDGRCSVSASGTGPVNVGNCFGGRFQASIPGMGSAITVSSLFGIAALSPGWKGPGAVVGGGGGLLIQDQLGYGAAGSQGAVFIAPQSGGGGSGTKGNLVMAGGGSDDGHITLASGHLWYDKTNKRFREKEGAPTSAADGAPFVTGTGSDSHGLLKWGDGSNLSMTTGDAVCQASGLICVRVMSLTGTASECTQTQGATYFYALCK